jgi:hypothetical protein
MTGLATRLDALAAKAAAATPGPWSAPGPPDPTKHGRAIVAPASPRHIGFVATADAISFGFEAAEKNGEFIAAFNPKVAAALVGVAKVADGSIGCRLDVEQRGRCGDHGILCFTCTSLKFALEALERELAGGDG